MRIERLQVAAALALVCVIWGSTYYAMRVALESFPPFTMGSIRFLLAGAAMYVALRARGERAPTAREWGAATLTGALLLVVGNGAVAFGQQRVSSSVAAIVVATMPLWAVLFGRVFGDRPSRGELLGVAIGFVGVALLHTGGDLFSHGASAIVMLLAPAGWALGSVWSRRLPLPGRGGLMAAAAQMLTGGAMMALVSLSLGEHAFAARAVSVRSVVAIAYLAIFGSIVAFSAYGFLLRHARTSTATSYAYVNPLIAVALGVAVGGEHVHAATLVGACVILSGVLVLSLARNAKVTAVASTHGACTPRVELAPAATAVVDGR
jgi:drug/metabolite transporter (DMT)-like permease